MTWSGNPINWLGAYNSIGHTCFRVYHQMGLLWGAWMHYRTCDLKPAVEGEKEQEIWKDIREEAAMWATVMTNIKKLLAASR